MITNLLLVLHDASSFYSQGVVVGSLYKLRVWHDDLNTASGWHLAQVLSQQTSIIINSEIITTALTRLRTV